MPFLVVRIRERLCALPVEPGMETMRLPAMQADRGDVPGLLGLAMLRGELAAVLDLATLLGLDESLPREGGRDCRLVSTLLDGRRVGFAVDAVLGVRELEPESLLTVALPGGSERRMGRFDEGFAQLMESAGFVTEERWAALHQVANGVTQTGGMPGAVLE